MKRSEARQAARLLGWRGSKAKRVKRPDPVVEMAFRQVVRQRLQEAEKANETAE